nr:hypothetical protein [Salipiger sp. PrR007]
MATALTDQEATQRKLFADVFPGGRDAAFAEAVQNDLMSGVTDQRLVLCLNQRDFRLLVLEIASVEGIGQQPFHLIEVNLSAPVALRKLGLGVQKPFDLGLRLKPSSRKAFECLPDDARKGFVRNKPLTVMGRLLISVAIGRPENPVPVLKSRQRSTSRLLCILKALVLRNGRPDRLNEASGGIFTNLLVRRLNDCLGCRDLVAE